MLVALIAEVWLLVRLFAWLLADRSAPAADRSATSCGADCLAFLLVTVLLASPAVVVVGIRLLRRIVRP
jgi:hypothetical protein